MPIDIATELGKRLFIWGVLAMVVVPRQHIDRTYHTIGGNLSHSFRKLLAASVLLNLVRLAAKLYGRVRLLADILGVLQVVSLTFICFLTPYVLQTWMASRINLPGGRPGGSLIGPLYATAFFSVLGLVLCKLVHPNLWGIKRLANVVSGPVVIQTVTMYNSITSVGGLHHSGRGTVMAQTLVVMEYWYIVMQLLCALGHLLESQGLSRVEYSSWDYCLQSFRQIAFVSDWLRVFVHGMFINLLDEMYLTSSSSTPSQQQHRQPQNNYDESEEPTSVIAMWDGAGGNKQKKSDFQTSPLLKRRENTSNNTSFSDLD